MYCYIIVKVSPEVSVLIAVALTTGTQTGLAVRRVDV